jgi:hypothetical protein
MPCTYCNKTISNAGSLAAHQKRCKLNISRVTWGFSTDSVPWNKGMAGDLRVKHTAKSKANISAGLIGKSTGKASTPDKELERIRKISDKAKMNNGGYRQGSGRGKKGWYKGFFCDSSWELAYVVYCLEHNISIIRNIEKRQYVWEKKIRNYIPDFIVEGKVTEIKGYKTKQWLAKLEANPDVTVLYEKDLEPVLDYVKSKYGKDFISLYE